MLRNKSKLDDTLQTLFHSYDARGNELAIDKAKQAIKTLFLELIGEDLEKDHCEGCNAVNWCKAEIRREVEAL